MRISNIVAKVENGVLAVGRSTKRLALNAKDRVSERIEDAKLVVLASQIQDTKAKLFAMTPDEKRIVNAMASEIQMIKDVATIRRNERRLRRALARRIKQGDVMLSDVENFAEAQGVRYDD